MNSEEVKSKEFKFSDSKALLEADEIIERFLGEEKIESGERVYSTHTEGAGIYQRTITVITVKYKKEL